MKSISLTVIMAFVFVCGWAQVDHIIQMKEDVKYLASDKLEGRETGTKSEKKAAKYISKRMKKLGIIPAGLEGSYYQDFEFKPKPHPHADSAEMAAVEPISARNVIGYIDNNQSNLVVIGAHYDHLGYGAEGSLYKGEPAIHNGADDNASGVALMLALAGYAQDNKDANYLFIAFSGEEKGLWGSNYFMKNPTIDTSEISYMLNFDMVGRLNEEKKLAINGVGTSPVFINDLQNANSDSTFKLILSESGVGPSDHTSFYLRGYPALHFFTGQHPDYHRPADDWEKLNYEGMDLLRVYLEKLMTELNSEPDIPFSKTKDEESRKAPKFSVTLGVVPDYLFDGEGMRIDGVSDGKPAQKAGIKAGDIVIRLGETEVTGMRSYMTALGAFNKGDQTEVEIIRDEEKIVLPLQF
ncbi:MAG TPA: peptidase M28 [Flavobacteriales bacterium]|nr:peptidase M28 [Flavobacteriales bacterium]